MKQTINYYDFENAFDNMGRGDQFSYGGLRILFDYLEEYEDSCGEEIELDVISLCCDYSEESWQDIVENYDIDLADCEDDDEKEAAVIEYLNDNTSVCGYSIEGIVYTQF